MKTAVKFLIGWSRYNAGEVAGFEDDVAKELIAKKVAEAAPKAAPDVSVLTVNVDSHEVQALIDDARAEFEELAKDQEAKAVDLSEREAALTEREADLAAREAALAEDGSSGSTPPVADPAKAKDGKPPKQGKQT